MPNTTRKHKQEPTFHFGLLVSADALLSWLNMFLPGARGGRFRLERRAILGRRGHPRGRRFMLLGEQVLQPAILHLQLGDASLKRGILLGRLAHGTLEDLLALLLLHPEAGRGGGIAAAAVFLGRNPHTFLLVQGGRDAVSRDGGGVLGVAHLAVGRRDGRGDVRGGHGSGSMAQVIGRIRDRGIDGMCRVRHDVIGNRVVDGLVAGWAWGMK